MMISAIFLAILIPTLYSLTAINAGVVQEGSNNGTAIEDQTNAAAAVAASAFNLNTLQHKIDTMSGTLNQIDAAMKSLEEKAHTWAIFRHHIDSWNDQMKALEHKLDLVKRTQDEQQAYGNKLISLEFTLNHILSKVVYLSDSCNTHMNSAATHPHANEDLHKELQHSLHGDKKLKNEISTRLSNILRHVQNIETDNCRHTRISSDSTTATSNKLAKLVGPIGGCNATQRNNYNVAVSLKALEQKINSLASNNFPQKDFKQMHSLTKKNSKIVENILNFVRNTDQRLLQWHGDGSKMLRHCQSLAGELTTFTESSDLLLKRIELMVRDVNEKVSKHQECTAVKDTEKEKDQGDEHIPNEHNPNAEDDDTNDQQEEEEEEEQEQEEVSTADTDTEVAVDNAVEEVALNEVEFIQPTKLGCHELEFPRIDGIYKFSTPELNEGERDLNERFCAFATDGIAWTVIQNRGPYAEQESFNRSWSDYRMGFGRLDKDFWFGNEFIHQMVYHDDYELRIELEDFNDQHKWIEYAIFRLDSAHYKYNLLIGGYRGSVPDAMHYHNEMDFSTYDQRNDRSVDACCACATSYASGWWFNNCSEANLNGVYHHEPEGHNYIGIIWEQWHDDYSLKKTRMMIRPKNWTQAHQMYDEFTEDP